LNVKPTKRSYFKSIGYEQIVKRDFASVAFRPPPPRPDRPHFIPWRNASVDPRNPVDQTAHDIVKQRPLFAVEAVGAGYKQISYPPQDVSARTNIAIGNHGFELIDQRLVRHSESILVARCAVASIHSV
jgi:hypothetical protein